MSAYDKQQAFLDQVITLVRSLNLYPSGRVTEIDSSIINPEGIFARAAIIGGGQPRTEYRMVGSALNPVGAGVAAEVVVTDYDPLDGSSTWLADHKAHIKTLIEALTAPSALTTASAPVPPRVTWSAPSASDIKTAQAPGYYPTTIRLSRSER